MCGAGGFVYSKEEAEATGRPSRPGRAWLATVADSETAREFSDSDSLSKFDPARELEFPDSGVTAMPPRSLRPLCLLSPAMARACRVPPGSGIGVVGFKLDSDYGFVIMIGSSESKTAGGPRAGPDSLSLATGVPGHRDRDDARRLDS